MQKKSSFPPSHRAQGNYLMPREAGTPRPTCKAYPPGERPSRFETSGLFRYIGDTSAISDGLQGFPAGSPMMTGLVATKKYLFWRISRHEFETFE